MAMTSIDPATGLFAKQDFLRLLAGEVAVAAKAGRPYAVLAVVPQHFADENVTDAVHAACACVRDLVREDDLASCLDGEIVAIGLSNVAGTSAAILGQRLQGDLRLRSLHLRSTLWEIGTASLPDDGAGAQELLDAAIRAAKTRRRRLAALI